MVRALLLLPAKVRALTCERKREITKFYPMDRYKVRGKKVVSRAISKTSAVELVYLSAMEGCLM
jgi:hypothetical protein